MEEDVDCGGPKCPICETCMDGMQNQDEEDIDCGGSNCSPCLPEDTCEDGILSGDEEDVDCGGSCPPCGGGRQTCLFPCKHFNNTLMNSYLHYMSTSCG